MKLTAMQRKAAEFIMNRNEAGMGALMPYAELIRAADELNDGGLAEDRGGTDRRWLTDAGRSALTAAEGREDE